MTRKSHWREKIARTKVVRRMVSRLFKRSNTMLLHTNTTMFPVAHDSLVFQQIKNKREENIY